eukprot:CAMPEP_0201511386 /NCGR_PEP_ID=MMETSP0161_2-20130828/3863_1 /ASSEMBLY_ACC=CAM_ASM_000251 /TAXON_ID=180227 /ORGANISM="Neoparamoeba aestuarina, Strain SoJaBio B1-5/56/2" /LENGTH=204 /DNA_ID=CAMNT_0047906861 /DNA_START=106 /DNA_END=716 /DNA_ORIENTATION=-
MAWFALGVAGSLALGYGYQYYWPWKALRFGDPLDPNGDLPLPLADSFEYFENNETARRKQGIFRLSGSAKRVSELIQQYESGAAVNLEDEEASTVCSLMKNFLKALPEPLIPFSFYPRFLDLAKEKDEEKWIEGAKELFAEMPKLNTTICSRLFALLKSIGEEEEHNQMGAGNLSKVIFPMILVEGPGELTPESLKHLPFLEKT